MSDTDPERQATRARLKQRLREKRAARSGGMSSTPASAAQKGEQALLSLCGDDPGMMRFATELLKNRTEAVVPHSSSSRMPDEEEGEEGVPP